MESTPKKKILVFVEWYIPGYKAGGPIKSIHALVTHLKHEFDFLIFTSNSDVNESIPYSTVESDKWLSVEEGVQVFYASRKFLNAKNVRRVLTEMHYDVVYLNSLFSVYFAVLPLLIYKIGAIRKPLIMAPRGMLGAGALQLKFFKKNVFLKIFDILRLHKTITWHATSEQEVNEIRNVFGKKIQVVMVPNLQYTVTENIKTGLEKKTDELDLYFLSRISEKKNLLFALEVLQSIHISPNQRIRFSIYGPIENQLYWEKCKKIISLVQKRGIQVDYHGPVKNEEVASVIKPFHFLFLPTLNENYGHVIVEALLNGKPLVISDQTPWINLEKYNVGWELPLQNSATFENILQKCLAMPDVVYQQMSKDTVAYAAKFCDSAKDIVLMKHMFENTIANG